MSTSIGEGLELKPINIRATRSKHGAVNHSATPAQLNRTIFWCNWSNFIFYQTYLSGTAVDYHHYSANGIVTGGNYDNTAGMLTIMDDAGPHYLRGFNPHGDVLLENKMIIGAFTGPNNAGTAIDLVYQG